MAKSTAERKAAQRARQSAAGEVTNKLTRVTIDINQGP